MPDEQRRTERAAGISRSGLNPNVVERPFMKQAAVRDSVEPNTAGHYQRIEPSPTVQVAADAEDGFFQHRLNASRQIHVPLLDGRVRPALRAAEQPLELAIRHPGRMPVAEVIHVQPKAAVGLE